MRKNNARIKANITMIDKINAIKYIVSSYFTDGEYTPYYSEMAQVIATVTYFMEGIEFEDGDDIYSSIVQDDEVFNIVTDIITDDEMTFVMKNVEDKVDFLKQQIIHKHADMDKIIEFCNIVIDSLDNFSKLNINQMKPEDMDNAMKVINKLAEKDFTAEDLSNVLKDAVGFNMDKATEEIIDAKNAEIRELKKYKALWEGRNVTASTTISDKVVPIKG